jgi:hypothetical protein
MTKIVYEVVEHDDGWAYKVDGVFSETFPSDDKARAAAERAEDARSRRSPLRSPRISPSWSSPFASIRDQLSYSKELAANEAYAANMGKHCFKWTSPVSEKSRWATGRRKNRAELPHTSGSALCANARAENALLTVDVAARWGTRTWFLYQRAGGRRPAELR